MPLELSTSGAIGEADVQHLIERVHTVAESLDSPVIHASVRLERSPSPHREVPVTVRATIDVNGDPIQVRVVADTPREAVDLLADRLRRRAKDLSTRRRSYRHRTGDQGPAEWYSGAPTTDLSPYYPRPVSEREVVQHKTFLTSEETIEEAIFELETSDYDFYLFTDLADGRDGVVWRTEDGGYGVRYVHESDSETSIGCVSLIALDFRPAPVLSLEQAKEQLDLSGDRFVLFGDTDTGRGHLLYRRYDGHYGLITPVSEGVAS